MDGMVKQKVLTQEEIERLFKVGLTVPRDLALFGICFYTGCRINEACTLQTSDAFNSAGVRDKLTIRKENTKGKQETRQIPVNLQLRVYLESYQDQVGKIYLFPGRHGRGHINPRSAAAILSQACDRIGLGEVGVSTHSFRRTSLTIMSAAGVPLRVIQEISGHRSLQALQRYLEVREEEVERAIAALLF